MPKFYDSSGRPTDNVTNAISNEESAPVSEGGAADTLAQLGALFGNSASLGLYPTIAGIVNPEHKMKALEYLAKAREEQGGLGTAAEIAGGFAVPLPGLGAIKGVTGIGKVLAGAGRGMIAGGISGGMTKASEQLPGEFDFGEVAKSAGLGAGVGGGLGAAAGTIGSAIAANANRVKFSAGGGTAGRIEQIAKSYPVSTAKGLEKAEDIADIAHKNKWSGGFGQSFEDVLKKTGESRLEHGKAIENILKTHGKDKLMTHNDFVDDILNPIIKEYHPGGMIGTKQEKALTSIQDEIIKLTGNTGKKGYVTLEDMNNFRMNIKPMVWGARGEKGVGEGIEQTMFAKLYSNVSNVEDRAMMMIDPAIAGQLKNHKLNYHAAKLWEKMAAKGEMSDYGLTDTLAGKGVRGGVNYMMGKLAGLPGIPAYMLQNIIGRGRLPNTEIWLADQAGKNRSMFGPLSAGRTSSLAGQLLGKTN